MRYKESFNRRSSQANTLFQNKTQNRNSKRAEINYSFLSEFIFSLNRIFFIYEQFKYVNIFTY